MATIPSGERSGQNQQAVMQQTPYTMNGFGDYKYEEVGSSCKARDYKDATDLVVNPQYIVRRLTPLECNRLQGFPDGWCADIGIANPSAEDVEFWRDVFETYRKVVSHSTKSKTEKQIIAWIRNPYSDSAEYKMWGNGIALPCADRVMKGIVKLVEEESK